MSDIARRAMQDMPAWLKPSMDTSLPVDWHPLMIAFLWITQHVLDAEKPETFLACFDHVAGGLQIGFGARPPLPPHLTNALRLIAEKIEGLASLKHISTSNCGSMPTVDQESYDCAASGDEPSISNIYAGETYIASEAIGDADSSDAEEIVSDDDRSPQIFDPDESYSSVVSPSNEQSVTVFSDLPTERQCQAMGAGREADASKRLMTTIRRLRATGTSRPVRRPAENWSEQLHQLTAEFPNFERVVHNIVWPHLTMVGLGVPHRMPPVLLVGQPGVGKTQFLRRLEGIFNMQGLFIDLAAETNGSALSGSSTFWANSQPGRVFEHVAWGEGGDFSRAVANPMIVLDEVDKASGAHSPVGGLFTLLEEDTATRFEDQSIPGVRLNLSRARFFLTANDITLIPEPLLSRVTTCPIEQPTPAQLRGIANRLFVSLLTKYEINLDPILPEEVLNDMSELSPRVTKMRLDAAIAIAVSGNKSQLDQAIWHQTFMGNSQRAAKMGFL
jgi:hypothetical protein